MICCLRRTPIAACIVSRFIHARAAQTPLAERRRKLWRPLNDHHSPGEGKRLTKNDSRFVLLPTYVKSEGRTKRTSQLRAQMQLSNFQGELLMHLQDAVNKNRLDHSVIGAAMQRCGQGRWWDALHKVRRIQKDAGLQVSPLCRNIYLTALGKSIRGEHGGGNIPARQKVAIPLGKEAWHEAGPTRDPDTFNSGLGAALTLCSIAKNPAGFAWGEELWEWALHQNIELNPLKHRQYLMLLASYQQATRVDQLLPQLPLTCVTLGALVNHAAEYRNWQRAEELWHKLTNQLGVEANSLSYCARAKAHLLCGRPVAAAAIIDEMLNRGHPLVPQAAESHFQSLLIVYHSALDPAQLERLSDSIQRGTQVLQEASANQRKSWKDMTAVFSRICENPAGVKLHDVLVKWNAQRSNMSGWPNYDAGTQYLKNM